MSRAQDTAFNPNKLLLDPYAHAHIGALQWDPAIFGYKLETGDDLTFDERDRAAFVPKCIVVNTNSIGKVNDGETRFPGAGRSYTKHMFGVILSDMRRSLSHCAEALPVLLARR